jgi:RNA polymerase sigma factor (sigma-70 family)
MMDRYILGEDVPESTLRRAWLDAVQPGISIRLDRAVESLAGAHPRTAQVVQLRFLAGLTTEETAVQLGLSPGTVKREWTFARAWLAAAMDDDDSGRPASS